MKRTAARSRALARAETGWDMRQLAGNSNEQVSALNHARSAVRLQNRGPPCLPPCRGLGMILPSTCDSALWLVAWLTDMQST
jgi:hypothetical protein